jgi:uridine phosphorylase
VKRSWYLGITPDEIAGRCLLVGDPGRVDLIASCLDAARVVTDRRGLRTVTGCCEGKQVTVAAFGMGAPSAVVVLEELASLGARIFLRAGTAMSVSSDLPLGSFVVGLAGMREEGTSASYAPLSYPAVADYLLTETLLRELRAQSLQHRAGIIASDDGFYSRLFPLRAEQAAAVADWLLELQRLHVVAADMETSAILTVGAVLGVRAGSLCLISVDAASHSRLEGKAMEAGERRLVAVALRAVAALGEKS